MNKQQFEKLFKLNKRSESAYRSHVKAQGALSNYSKTIKEGGKYLFTTEGVVYLVTVPPVYVYPRTITIETISYDPQDK